MKGKFAVAALCFLAGALFAFAQAPAVTHNTWSSGAAMPTAVWQPAGTAVLKGQIYVVGGRTTSGVGAIADTQVYNPKTNSWTNGVPLPTATEDGSAAVVKNILYIFGGYTASGYTNAAWAFNPKTKAWSSVAAMPTTRDSTTAVVEDNIIYVIGGEMNGNRFNTVDSYNPATDTWTEEAPLINGKSEPTGGLVGKTIVVADGYTSSSGDNGDNEGYDAATNSWTAYNPDPTPRNEACGSAIGSEMYVAGGYPAGGPGTPAFDVNESFKVSKDSWATLASMPQATMGAGSAVYSKQLYCFGGTSTYLGTVLNNVQIYQP